MANNKKTADTANLANYENRGGCLEPHRDPRKGVRGAAHPRAKLNWEKVHYIRANPDELTQRQMAEKLRVSFHTIKSVRQNRTWVEDGGTPACLD